MRAAMLRVYIKRIELKYDGDTPASQKTRAAEESEDSIVLATFRYPRPGRALVSATKELSLQSGVPQSFETNDFWENGLFKETIVGETQLEIAVSDRDQNSAFLRAFTALISAGLVTLAGGATGGISNLVLQGAANKATDAAGGVFVVGEGSEAMVAKSKTVGLIITPSGLQVDGADWNPTLGELRIPLYAPRNLNDRKLRHRDKRKGSALVIPKDGNNGEVVLEVQLEPVPLVTAGLL